MKYIGLDLGTKTLGIATSDLTGTIASPYKTIRYSKEESMIAELLIVLEEKEIEKIVIGMPINMNGSKGESALRTEDFINILKTKTNIVIDIQDERLSTREAQNILISADVSRMKRKKVIDKLAAVVILQNYLNKKKGR